MDSLGCPVTNTMPYPALPALQARAHSEIAEQFLHYAALAKCVCKQLRLARCNREIPRVQIEDLCEGCISLSIAEGLQKNCTKRSVPLTFI